MLKVSHGSVPSAQTWCTNPRILTTRSGQKRSSVIAGGRYILSMHLARTARRCRRRGGRPCAKPATASDPSVQQPPITGRAQTRRTDSWPPRPRPAPRHTNAAAPGHASCERVPQANRGPAAPALSRLRATSVGLRRRLTDDSILGLAGECDRPFSGVAGPSRDATEVL